MSLAERRRCVTYLTDTYGVSERRACQAMQIHRSSYRFKPKRDPVDAVHRRVVELSQRYPYWGYRKMCDLMQAEGNGIGRERVRLIRRREGLQVPARRHKRRVLGCSTTWVHRASYPGHVWSYDFVFDQTEDGRRLKCLTVVDEFTRQGLAITVGRSLTAVDVIATLDSLFETVGRPECLRSDNGPELISDKVQSWLKQRHVNTHYIDPGSPWQNAYGESFNSIFRTTCLDRWLFSSMAETRAVIKQWLEEYNTVRPHGSLNGMNPEQYLDHWQSCHADLQPEALTL